MLAASQDKFRQINKMVEIFAPLIQGLSAKSPLIVDMGAGKAISISRSRTIFQGRVSARRGSSGWRCARLWCAMAMRWPKRGGFAALRFAPGSILDYDAQAPTRSSRSTPAITATDDAIFKGIEAGAELIAVAPCCHKQVRREMEAGTPDARLDVLLRHGTMLEKQAEMVTDALRALLLEANGYRTRVFEFVSDAHTPKNNLIVAQKARTDREEALRRLRETKALFGVRQHYLETLLGL